MNAKIRITVNGKRRILDKPLPVRNLWEEQKETKKPDIVILNGFPLDDWGQSFVKDGDSIVLVKKGQMPSRDEFESMLTARNSPDLQKHFRKAVVGIAGLGGLGSHVAMALARTGVGHLVLVDFDLVEPSNLNRQCYDAADIGRNKTDALADRISRFNPFVKISRHQLKLDKHNVFSVFSECDVVVEAFDRAEGKEMLVHAFGSLDFHSKCLVTASGLAGIGSPNDIQTRRLTHNIFLCGDLVSAAKQGEGLMAPRVMIAAGHQATAVLRILAGRE
ncbi:MAG: sulfur carrier protein ThiS adenylyltransferase ThiF [Acidobacteria bacterium]|nr:sulfur carrier protein ThiS adenylyltransferase ThiF [Acidobacteriota bacterium]